MPVTTTMQAKDNVSYIQLFGKGLPENGRTATKEEAASVRKWISEACRNELAIVTRNEKYVGDGRIVVHLINYPIKESPMVIQSFGEHIQLTDPAEVVHILEHEQLRAFLNGLDK